MNTLKLLPWLALVLVSLVTTTAASFAQEAARIVKIVGTGSATVVIDGQAQRATELMRLPVDAEVRTSSQEVYVEVVPGVVSTVKPQSDVRVDTLIGPAPALELREGTVVSEIDRKRIAGKSYSVKTARGIAAARGTSFTVSIGSGGFTVLTTADTVSFTTPGGENVMIQAGMVSVTPAGATNPAPPVPLAAAVAADPGMVAIIQDAVQTAATVVQSDLGGISAESATNIISQVVAVAAAAVPSQASSFAAQAVAAVTATGSATAGTPALAAMAAGSVTAAAVGAVPDQAAQIAAAAAQAAPAELTGVITAAAQQVAPAASDAIAQQVATATGQSVTAVQSNATAATAQADQAVNAAYEATSNVVTPPANAAAPAPGPNANASPNSHSNAGGQSTEHSNAGGQSDQHSAATPKAESSSPEAGESHPAPPKVTTPPTTPGTPVDPELVSPAS